MNLPKTEYTAALAEVRFVTSNVVFFRFTRPDGFAFKAGQFVQFKIPHNGSVVWRSYSIASAPSAPYLDFCIKIIPGGVASEYLKKLTLGSTIIFTGPEGRFVADPSHPLHKIFIGTGTGLAPIMSIITERIEAQIPDEQLELIFGVRMESDIFWSEELLKLANRCPNFRHKITLSRPENDSWGGAIGRVTAHIAMEARLDAEYFVCGSLEMIKDVRAILLANQVAMKHIHFEIF